MIPSFIRMQIRLMVPKDTPAYADAVGQMQNAVQVITNEAVQISQAKAPGEHLRYQIEGNVKNTETGAEGEVWMPKELGYTLRPGTRPHFIPGGRAVHSYGEAAAIQIAKGYPMRFYWEKAQAVVYRWSVYHPGYKGTEWDTEVISYLGHTVRRELGNIYDHIAQRWGSEAVKV